jgi:alanyl-tRNA synthetase
LITKYTVFDDAIFKMQEIHYDRIGGRDASERVNADLPDVIEIWNNVFIQFNREADGSLRPLPSQHVDTGMGFERLTSILQGVDSNYDTDIFQPLFEEIRVLTGAQRPYGGKVGPAEDDGFVDMAYRVIADHVRTLSFAIADGAVPSNDGRGYVLRRVLRRAVRYGRQNLGAELGFFSKLVPKLVEIMGKTFPEIIERQDYIISIIREEEESFSRTLDKGLQKFKDLAAAGDKAVFSGTDAHYLYTTMGFPIDLTELMAEELGLAIDKDGFEARMKEEQEISQAAHMAKMAGGSGKDMRMVAEQTSHLVNTLGVPATDDSAKHVAESVSEGSVVKALFIGRGETEDMIGFVDSVSKESSAVGIILDKTSFYAEQGGQINDIGDIIKAGEGATVRITNVQLYGSFVLHLGEVVEGTLTVGDSVSCSVDYVRRHPITSNHTMTHVLNHALREVLVTRPAAEGKIPSGVNVDQKGSLVDEFKSRFDFSWNAQLTPQQLADVESLCREQIEKAIPVEAYVAPLVDAEKIGALRAVFGEKYPDPVRIVAVANSPVSDILANPQDTMWNKYSVEFCGGTHLKNTKDADAFCLLSEEGIAKGIRRIVFVTYDDAKKAIATAEEFETKLEASSKLEGGDELEALVKTLSMECDTLVVSKVKTIAFRETIAGFLKKVMAWKKQRMAGMTDEIKAEAIKVGEATEGNKVIFRYDFGLNAKLGKNVATAFTKKIKDKAIMIISADADSNRFLVLAMAAKGLDVDCKAWCMAATEGMDAKGGGKKDSAQVTVSDASLVESVMEKAKQ